MKNFYVGSEVGQLRKVILHEPGLCLNRLTPSNCESLLFDDVLRSELAIKEHRVFQQILRDNGAEVFLLGDLLIETLANPSAKRWILDHQVHKHRFGESLAKEIYSQLMAMDNPTLVQHLIGGLTVSELDRSCSSMTLDMLAPHDFLIEPIPNHLFTRDASCWLYGGVSMNPMAKLARQRETVHMRAIYNYHSMFMNEEFITYLGNRDYGFDRSTIEGGDVLVLGRGTVLVGMSERTTPQGVEQLTRSLFKTGQANKVIALQLPKARSCMHLDTVLTQMDIDCFTYYPDIIKPDIGCWELTLGAHEDIVTTRVKDGFAKALERALGISELRLVPTGGDYYQAEREQWNDANNVLALRPGVVVTYERNIHTINNMRAAGIEVLTIPGEDLGRGRGGARCMSCPILRDDI